MSDENNVWQGSCHCKSVRFTAQLPDGFLPHRCNCSMCEMKSTVVVDLPETGLEVTAGRDKLSSYSFGTNVAKHWFCSVCGIHTFQNLRSDPDKMSVNAACLDDFDIWSIETVPVHDGRDNHPTDTGKPRQYYAVQRLEFS